MVTTALPTLPRADLAQAAAMAREPVADKAVERERERPSGVEVVRDPTLMMQELAEELGFLKAEELAGSDEVDGDQDEAFEDLINDLIRKSLKASKVPEAQMRQDAEALRDRLVQMGITARSGQQLDDALRRFTGGSSQRGLALMAELARLAQTDPALQQLGFGREAIETYATAHEAGLTSALNVAEVLDQAPGEAASAAERILGLYEESITHSQSVLQTFQRLGRSEGISTIADWRAFLTEAVAADLAKQRSGGEKVQLQLILQELKGFRTFNTLTQGLERLMKFLPREAGVAAPQLMQTSLDYIEQPIREFPNFEAWAQSLALSRRILFFQNMRNLLKSLPDDAYASPEQKAGAMVPLQKKVDDLTWSEEV
jgi:hypothetical protein